MPEISGTRVLFLDDSGKPSFSHPSRAVVTGGFSVPSQLVPELCTAINRAKSALFPERGSPYGWEMKSRLALKSFGRRRSRQALLVDELAGTLSRLKCTTYTVSIRKDSTHHELSLKNTMPLQLTVLAEHFAVECQTRGENGILVSDRGGYALDSHASQQVARFSTARDLPVHPCVYFADSLGLPAIQLADLIAGARRRAIEGDRNSASIAARVAAIRSLPDDSNLQTQGGRPYETQIDLFR